MFSHVSVQTEAKQSYSQLNLGYNASLDVET